MSQSCQRMSKRSFSEDPVMMVYRKSGAVNQNSDSLRWTSAGKADWKTYIYGLPLWRTCYLEDTLPASLTLVSKEYTQYKYKASNEETISLKSGSNRRSLALSCLLQLGASTACSLKHFLRPTVLSAHTLRKASNLKRQRLNTTSNQPEKTQKNPTQCRFMVEAFFSLNSFCVSVQDM